MREDELDLRLQADDIETYVANALAERRLRNVTTSQVILRPEQVKALMRSPTSGPPSPTERLHSIFGVPIVVKPDGLTPRERSIRRALAEFPPTREEQVAAALDDLD